MRASQKKKKQNVARKKTADNKEENGYVTDAHWIFRVRSHALFKFINFLHVSELSFYIILTENSSKMPIFFRS